MASLNTAKQETKIILMLVGFAFVAIMLFFMGVRVLSFITESFSPPPPPEVAFGKLPPINFPEQAKENLSFTLDTLSGYLPNFSDRAKIFKIINEPPTLLGLDRSSKKVSEVGFTSSGIQISEDIYRWTNQSSLPKTINMNIFSSDFSLSSPYLTYSLANFLSYEKDAAVQVAKSFLSDLSLFPQDIDEEKTKVRQFNISSTSLIPTTKISNTKLVKVDFFQKDVDELPVYYDKGISSTIEFLVGKESEDLKIVEARYYHRNISDKSSTYSIKTASQAFSELQKGNAYIAYKPANRVEFKIRNVLLGYYIGESRQDYLMPIIIFEGTDNFTAYVSAVKDELISN